MNDEQKQGACGCIILVIVALLIGVGLRAQSLIQFLVMGGEILLGIAMLVWGLASLSEESCLSKLWGLWCGIWCLALIVSVGYFLITGNYEQSTMLAGWNAGKTTPTPTVSVQATPTTTATSTSQLTLTPTAVTTPQPASDGANMVTPAPSPVPIDTIASGWQWRSEVGMTYEQVTEALNKIWALPFSEAGKTAEALTLIKEGASGESKRAARLITAVAFERAGDVNTARTIYQEIIEEKENDPYATSAQMRLRLVQGIESGQSAAEITTPESDEEEIYTAIFKKTDAEGWFLIKEQWIWDTTRRFAAQFLVSQRADQLWFRFFQFLRLQSPFPPPYAYIYILLVLTVGITALALPLYARAVKISIQLSRLGPEIQMIQIISGNDLSVLNQRLTELYKRNGLNPWGGCAVAIVNPIFIIWALVTMDKFTPQLLLDGARLFWCHDVTRPDLGILAIWIIASLVQFLLSKTSQQLGQQLGQSPALTLWSTIIGSALVAGIAWGFKWPAYVFVFWILLLIVGALVNGILKVIYAR